MLQELFQEMKVVEVVELGLGANAALSDIHRLHWNTASSKTGTYILVIGGLIYSIIGVYISQVWLF